MAAGFVAWATTGEDSGRDRGPVEAPRLERAGISEPATASSDATPRRRAPGVGTLRVSVRSPDGRPRPGRVFWICSPASPSTSSALAPEYGYPLPADAQQIEHQGVATIRVPAGHWTWLRATASGRGSCRYARVAPFRGRRDLELRLGLEYGAIHAFVLGADLATPARQREVTLFAIDPRRGSSPRRVRTVRTDALGYVVFTGLRPGGYLVCAPGARPGDPSPHTQRVVLAEAMGLTELPCTVVVPEPRRRVRLAVTASFRPRLGDAPKLFFSRFGDREGELFPVPGVVRPGANEMQAELPPGDYRLRVLPQWRLRFVGGQLLHTVASDRDTTVTVRLVENSPRMKLTLRGIGGRYFPVTVSMRPASRVLEDDRGLVFAGPYKWHMTEQTVEAPQEPVRVVAWGTTGCWISEQMLPATSGAIAVDMLPAVRLRLACKPADMGKRQGAMVEVRTRLGTDVLYLRKQLLQERGNARTALAASIVVPRGRVEVTWARPEPGLPALHRVLEAKGIVQRIDLP